jgi:hypothetical protein
MTRTKFFIGLMVAGLCGAAFAGNFIPFYDKLKTDEGSFFAVRPFYSHAVMKDGEVRDVFWPLYSRKSFKDEKTSRALLFYFTHQFDASEETPRARRWLFPFYFQGRNVHDENYLALFPLGGNIYEFLGRDRIQFWLFPIFGKSQINDVKTTSVLWPIVSRTRGEGIRRDRVFPIIGKSVLEDQYEKRFVLWPFWTSAEYFYLGDSGKSWILFPLCGRADMDNEQTLWLIPPFFRFTKGAKQDRLLCPWPFIQKMESEQHDKFYVWPLWGKDQYAGGNHRTFLFWPVLWSEKTEEAHLTKTRRRAVPFFLLEREFLREQGVLKEEQVEVSRYWRLWPLMSWRREENLSRFRMLELWPVKDSAPIERNWAPLWTLYKRTNVEGLIRKEVCWFAWHSEKDVAADHTEWSLLKGLLSYKKEGGARSGRVLWFKLGK